MSENEIKQATYNKQKIVDDIIKQADIVNIISRFVELKEENGLYFGLCPFHNEKEPSFSVDKTKNQYYCYGCGKGGNVYSFLMKYLDISLKESIEYIAELIHYPLSKNIQNKQNHKDAATYFEINKKAATYFYKTLRSNVGKEALDYLIKRGLDEKIRMSFGLGYSNKSIDDIYKYLKAEGYSDDILKNSGLVSIDEKGARDKFINRVIFPIFNLEGKVIAFGGRVMDDSKPKYLNSPETPIFDKSKTLFGLYIAQNTSRDYFILSEGYMDVIALHQAGFDNAIASLGTALTQAHVHMIKEYGKEVYLSYDSDQAGQKAVLRAIPMLEKAQIKCKVINMLPHKDPDEFIKALGVKEYEKRILNAEDSFLFQIKMIIENQPENDFETYREIAKLVVKKYSSERELSNAIDLITIKFNLETKILKRYVIKMNS